MFGPSVWLDWLNHLYIRLAACRVVLFEGLVIPNGPCYLDGWTVLFFRLALKRQHRWIFTKWIKHAVNTSTIFTYVLVHTTYIRF
jgi:hypothetical protein